MVKDEHHRTRALLYQGRELPLPESGEVFRLLTRIQDEVHRFAIEYHRSLREKTQIRSLLDEIPGIGAVRKKALMKEFKDIDHIKTADIKSLAACPSMDIHAAERVYRFFRGESTA